MLPSHIPQFIDSHCHLDLPEIGNLEAVLARARARGVVSFVVPAVSEQHWPPLQAMASEYSDVYHAVGVHPWWVEAIDAQFLSEFQQRLISASYSACAIGETGLCALKGANLTVQKRWFVAQLEVAVEMNKPVIMHAVRTHAEMLQVLRRFSGKLRGVLHGFAGSSEIARQYWQLGFHIGVGGTITYPRAAKTRRAVQDLPLEALLLETDSPDMPLSGYQGKANQPYQVAAVAEALAELRQISIAELAAVTQQTTMQLFALPGV